MLRAVREVYCARSAPYSVSTVTAIARLTGVLTKILLMHCEAQTLSYNLCKYELNVMTRKLARASQSCIIGTL